MYHIRRNKSELIVLTGAIYSFVAYLTAFTLEILFLVDLNRRSTELMSTLSTPTATSGTTSSMPVSSSPSAGLRSGQIIDASSSSSGSNINLDEHQAATLLDRFNFESMQAHITVACLTISILYFVFFITSLTLIVALILRSTFMLLIWMCAMSTMYLPEFGLVIYVSVYSWGLDTRNGQTELIFYLFRAVLNLIFVYRARKLFKQWNYEKSFFRLKSGSAGAYSTGSQQFGHSSPYDSPYFIGRGSSCGAGGDSLSTTINPIFSSSTLNLNCYDFVRDQYNHQNNTGAPGASSRTTSPMTVSNSYGVFSSDATCDDNNNSNMNSPHSASRSRLAAAPSRERQVKGPNGSGGARLASRLSYNPSDTSNQYNRTNSSGGINYLPQAHNTGIRQFYLGDGEPELGGRTSLQQHHRQLSMLSIDDNFPDYELDLDYRTLGKSAGKQQHNSNMSRENKSSAAASYRGQHRTHQQPTTTGHRFNPQLDDHHSHEREHYQHQQHQQQRQSQHQQTSSPSSVRMQSGASAMTRNQDDSAYSTRSLDRRNLKDFTLTEQVVLRPLGHQPFEYLQRPGSTTNLNYD